ncbi:Asp23/Gls24 family envelope stress response protein [Actinoplanes sp. GCM10030250]|uniref:Asp23/Gls24 family envelope stress response protein n=1 Tax=Actinoplanes sp. GCM10030250 TaxID=3273376 RepID=UPI00362464BA
MSEATNGSTTVSSEVVQKIAGAAARGVPGVAELGGDVARFFNSVLDKVGLDEVGDATRGVSAKVTGSDVTVGVVLVLEAGRVVAEVTAEVQAKVKEALSGYGLNVLAVNVNVDDITGV